MEFLESPERRKTEDPDALWDRAGLRPGETVVEVGAGSGYFAVPAALRVGRDGRVNAVDVSLDLVQYVRERAASEALPQLVGVQSTETSIPLESGIADVVLLANVLHDIPDSTLAEAVRLLKQSGRFVNVDWRKAETPFGPPYEIRLTPEQAASRIQRQGLRRRAVWEFGPWHYGLTFART